MRNLVALIAGVLFGLGMMVSGMVLPENVIGFLDITGDWNPSLMFVMGGALLVFVPVYFFVIRRLQKPVCSESFHVTKKTSLDAKLIFGAAIFGVGWGLMGVCPGPVITAIGAAEVSVFVFIGAMMVGIWMACQIDSISISLRKKESGLICPSQQ